MADQGLDLWQCQGRHAAEARGIVSLIKDSAATSPIFTHRLRNNVRVFGGSGENIAVLTGPDGEVLIDVRIGVSQPQLTKALAELGDEPVAPASKNNRDHFIWPSNLAAPLPVFDIASSA